MGSAATGAPSWAALLHNSTDRTPRDYSSAQAYADAVRAWCLSSHQWLQCQQQHFLQHACPPQPTNSLPRVSLTFPFSS